MTNIINAYLDYTEEPDVNIGDYIQTISAQNYFNTDKKIPVERSKLNQYDGELAKISMNCWFGSPGAFPPACTLSPLFRSFHLNSTAASQILKDERSLNYLKQYSPIGCRDEYTATTLRNFGVDAFFSGCLTTTIGLHTPACQTCDKIMIVDLISTYPNMSFLERVLDKTRIFIFGVLRLLDVRHIFLNLLANCPLKVDSFSRFISLFLYCSRTALIIRNMSYNVRDDRFEYYTHLFAKTDLPESEARFDYARQLIARFSKARLVVSSRIHAVLPCLGLDTPHIYLQQKNELPEGKCRKEGLLDLLNVVEVDMYTFKDISIFSNISDLKNKNIFRDFQNRLNLDYLDFFNEFD